MSIILLLYVSPILFFEGADGWLLSKIFGAPHSDSEKRARDVITDAVLAVILDASKKMQQMLHLRKSLMKNGLGYENAEGNYIFDFPQEKKTNEKRAACAADFVLQLSRIMSFDLHGTFFRVSSTTKEAVQTLFQCIASNLDICNMILHVLLSCLGQETEESILFLK